MPSGRQEAVVTASSSPRWFFPAISLRETRCEEESPHLIDSINAALEQVSMIATHKKGVPNNHGTNTSDRQWVPPLCVHAPKTA